ncbi:MAG: hypothetical protein AAB659_01940 [Patescibacteria group bacterium]
MNLETSEEKKKVAGHVHYGIQKTALDVTKWVGSPTSILIHSFIFVGAFWLALSGLVALDRMLLVLTTIVSLEAIYLSLLIQMTINYTTQSIEEVAEDIEEIQEDVDELQEDVEEMSEEDKEEETREKEQKDALTNIHSDLKKLVDDINRLKGNSS